MLVYPLIFLFLFFFASCKYVPVVIMHGLNSSKEVWEEYYVPWLKRDFPEMYVKVLEVGDGVKDSIFYNFDDYVDEVASEIMSDPELKDGFTFIGHSQGGVVARSYIERYNNPPALQFVSLSSPQGGYYCAPDDCMIDLGEYTYMVDYFVSELFYTDRFQDIIMPAAYWKDPTLLDLYKKECRVLPYINNEIELEKKYKENFMSVKRLLIVGSSNDEFIIPYRSAFFEFYKDGSITEITPLEESVFWKEDQIGLRALYEEGKVEFVDSYLHHTDYSFNEPFYQDYIKDFVDVDYECFE